MQIAHGEIYTDNAEIMVVNFQKWRMMSKDERHAVLQTISLGVLDEDELEEIAPELRIPDFDDTVGDYFKIQLLYHERLEEKSSTSSASIARKQKEDSLLKEIVEMNKQFARMMQQQERKMDDLQKEVFNHERPYNANETIREITRQNRYLYDLIQFQYEVQTPRYDVIKEIEDCNGMLTTYFIQTPQAQYNEFSKALEHFLGPESPASAIMRDALSISIAIYVDIEGRPTPMHFTRMPSQHGLYAKLEQMFDDSNGSDKAKQIRSSISSVRVNVARLAAGGIKEKTMERETICPPFRIRYVRDRVLDTNSCFYQCCRLIMRASNHSHVPQYSRMKNMIVGHDRDEKVYLDETLMNKTESTFNIKFIIFANSTPKTLRTSVKTDGTYANTKAYWKMSYEVLYASDLSSSDLEESNDKRFITTHTKISKSDRDGLISLQIKDQEYAALLYHDSHYSVIRGFNRIPVCEKCGTTKHSYEDTFKDKFKLFECITELKEYLVLDEYNKFVKQVETIKIYFDIETVVSVMDNLIPYSIAWGYYEGETKKLFNSQGRYCVRNFLAEIQRFKKMVILIGYNSSRFDNFIIIHDLIDQGIAINEYNCCIFRNQVLSLNLPWLRVWDLCQFTKCSLEDAYKTFLKKTDEGKETFDHKSIQNIYDEAPDKFFSEIKEKKLDTTIKKYNERDVEMLMDVEKLVYKELARIHKTDPTQFRTLSSLCYSSMVKDNRENKIMMDTVPEQIVEMVRTIPAGRTQVFEEGSFEEDFVQVDYNSLYPDVCIKYEYPEGKIWNFNSYEQYLKESRQRKFVMTLLHAEVDQSRSKWKFYGVKPTEKEKTINWTNDHCTVYTFGDVAEKLNSTGMFDFKPLSVVAWEKSCKPFNILTSYLEERKIAKQNRNIVEEKMQKLSANATTGKMIQQDNDRIWLISKRKSEIHNFLKKYTNIQFSTTNFKGLFYLEAEKETKGYSTKPVVWGHRIYELARLEMFMQMSKLSKIYYTDTDSLLIRREEVSKISTGLELGMFKVEGEGHKAIIAARKNYCLIGKEENKYRLKSFREKDNWYVLPATEEDVTMTNIELLCCCKGTGYSEQLFEYIIDPSYNVYTISNPIRKQFRRNQADNTCEISYMSSPHIVKLLS